MERIKGYIGRLFYLCYLLSRINWWRLFRAHDRSADTVVWVLQDVSLLKFLRYLQNNNFLNDLAIVAALLRAQVPFRIKVGRGIGGMTGKRILYSISQQFNLYDVRDHAAPMLQVVAELERQGNLLLPTAREASLWENKAHMHREFERLGVRCPRTRVISGDAAELDVLAAERFPLLLKETHSASAAGVRRMNDHGELVAAVRERVAQGQSEFLVQELLDMRRDLRVILVDGEIVLHYWRINQGKEWRPTSTGHGSNVDFVMFPERWRAWIVESFRRLEITTGAFDIAWQGDDLETEPYILEVSPLYMPNPPLPAEHAHLTYAQYKKILLPYPRYLIDYIDVVFAIRGKVVAAYLKNHPFKGND